MGVRVEKGVPAGRLPAVLLAAVAVTAAVAGALASTAASDASTSWQVSVRDQLAQAEAIRNGLEGIYLTEAPEAAAVVAARVRARQLAISAAALPEPDRSALQAQAAAAAEAADRLVAGAAPLGHDDRYRRADGIDVARRLGDLRASQGPAPPDPGMAQAAGDGQSDESVRLVAATIPVGIAFLLGAMAQAFPTARRWLLGSGAVLLALAAAVLAVEATM